MKYLLLQLVLPASASATTTETSAAEAAKTSSAEASATTGEITERTTMAPSGSHHAAH